MYHSKSRIPFIFTCCFILGGCASTYPEPPLANMEHPYKEPIKSDTTSVLEGTIAPSGLIDAVRARAESIDMKWVYSGTGKPKDLELLSGFRSITAVCEKKYGTGKARAVLEFEVKSNRHYVLRCKNKSILWNKGKDFWIEDKSNNNEVVSKASGWGPTTSPSGKVF